MRLKNWQNNSGKTEADPNWFLSKSPIHTIVLSALIFALACFNAYSLEIYVTEDGKDTGFGTLDSPFATIEKARDTLRESGLLGKEVNQVWVGPGTYRFTKSLTFGAEDSGSEEFPVTYRSEPHGARLSGGITVLPSAFAKMTSKDSIARVNPGATGKVLELDVERLGVEHIAAYPNVFQDNGGILELFVGGKRLPISHYPNDFGGMKMKKVLDTGGGPQGKGEEKNPPKKADEPPSNGTFQYRKEHQAAHERWARSVDRGVWMKGYWRVVWENAAIRVGSIDTGNRTVTFAARISNGIGSKYHRPEGSGEEVYWVMNLLEEIDEPGEWAIDFVEKKLYLYPPAGFEDSIVVMADTKAPVISTNETSNIIFRGFDIDGSLAEGIKIGGGENVSINGCTVSSVTGYAIYIDGGLKHTVRSCDLHDLGAGGIWVKGGDQDASPRIPSGHLIINNDIHHFGQVERVYAPGVNVGYVGGGSRKMNAVGVRVAHNSIHDCPHAGVLFNSFDNVYEYNEIFRFALASNDMGAFYSFAIDGCTGNNTFRGNFMHSSPEGDGIYYDNQAGYPKIVGNISYRIGPQTGGKPAARGSGYLIKNFNKSPVTMTDNLAIDCKVGFSGRWGEEGSLFRDNISIGSGEDKMELPGIADLNGDPGFVDMGALDFTLRTDLGLRKMFPNFTPVDFEKIGLYKDEFRTELPDYRTGAAKWVPGEGSVGYEILDRE